MGGGSEVKGKKVVTEYVRRGSRFGPEVVRVGFLPELLEELGISLEGPIQLEPEPDRLRLLLTIIGVEGAAEKLRNIPPEQIVPVLAVRWAVSVLNDRVVESGGSEDRLAEKWTRSEVEALLLAFIRPTPGASHVAPEIGDRHVQLTAQVLASIGAIILLAQALLLDLDRCLPLNLVTHFSGKGFHQLLNNGRIEASFKDLIDHLMDVVTTGLDAEAFADEASNTRKAVKGQKKTENLTPVPTARRDIEQERWWPWRALSKGDVWSTCQ